MSVLDEFEGVPRDVFIETGTGNGATLANAIKAGFNVCHSIEYDRGTFEQAVKRFGRDARVVLHRGASVDILPLVIRPSRPTTFWLDAHYSGGTFDYDSRHADRPQCSLLDELTIIVAAGWQADVAVLVDDAFMFEDDYWTAEDPQPFGAGWRESFRRDEWPTLPDIWRVMAGWPYQRVSRDVMRFDLAA